MKLNESTAILTPRILLVPYSVHHVPTYHEWMKDEDLQTLTASEPLSIAEEYAMQKSWREDADKLTFIICEAPRSGHVKSNTDGFEVVRAGREDALAAMIGDVNLFLYDGEAENDDTNDTIGNARTEPTPLTSTSTAESRQRPVVGELEIMLAFASHRGKGLAHDSLLAFLFYISTNLDAIFAEYDRADNGAQDGSYLKYLRVKINKDNVRSLVLFEKVGFRRTKEKANYFGEVEMRMQLEGLDLGANGFKSCRYED